MSRHHFPRRRHLRRPSTEERLKNIAGVLAIALIPLSGAAAWFTWRSVPAALVAVMIVGFAVIGVAVWLPDTPPADTAKTKPEEASA